MFSRYVYNIKWQTCAKIKNPGSWISWIQDPESCRMLDLTFSFSHGILEILDPATATLPWDPKDLGSPAKRFCRILGILDSA